MLSRSEPDPKLRNASVVDVVMLGARLHYAVPLLLDRAGILGTLYTDGYLGNKPRLKRLVKLFPKKATPASIRRLQGRDCPGLSQDKVVSYDSLGLLSNWLYRNGWSNSNANAVQTKINKTFGQRVARGLNSASAVYGFNGASLEVFHEAKRRGLRCILEQTIAPYRLLIKMLAEEAESWPEWEPDQLLNSDAGILAEREEAEWTLADQIVCGSTFVEEGLSSLAVEREKCRVVPYGIDVTQFRRADKPANRSGLNVLFVGEVGLRKGVPYLLAAMRHVDSSRVRCRLAGTVSQRPETLAGYGQVEFLGSVPRSQIQKTYDWADVLVLPSICEGSALVTYEAMACGLPIITTPNAGSTVRDGEEGFIVPIRDPCAIAERIDHFSSNRKSLADMSAAARRRSEQFSWEEYGRRLLELIAAVDRAVLPKVKDGTSVLRFSQA